MKENVKKVKDAVKARFESLRNDENGMEAAQVILILAIVLIALVPVIRIIVNKVSEQGSKAQSCIDGTAASGC